MSSYALYLENHAATVHPNAADHAFANEFLGTTDAPLIALHPGSGSPRKNWPRANWLALGAWLLARTPQPRLLLIGGEADHAQLDTLAAAWRGAPVLPARDLPLPHLAALLARCRLFLGHDSGISHLAAAAGAPCVLLFGPTDPVVWAPANPHVSIVAAPGGDLAALPIAAVQAATVRVLGGR